MHGLIENYLADHTKDFLNNFAKKLLKMSCETFYSKAYVT